MVTEQIHTTVETGEVEREVTLTFSLTEAEKPSHTSPGCPADAELIGATFDDTGADVPEGLLSDIEELGQEALAKRADREAAMAEDAAEARRDYRRGC